MNVKFRQKVEREIAEAVVKSMTAAGYTFKVCNGEDETPTEGEAATLAAMFATDEDRLCVVKDGKVRGWVLFIYGNTGWDVISDYTTNLEPLLKDAQDVSDKYA